MVRYNIYNKGSNELFDEIATKYNIDNPRDARFKKDTMMVKFIGIPIIAVFYIIAIVMIVVGIKKSRKQESENLSI